MKTTLELPDDLMREIRVKAAREDRKLKDVIPELLRRGLDSGAAADPQKRVQFPLIRTAHPAPPGQELTPEVVHEILLNQEIDWLVK